MNEVKVKEHVLLRIKALFPWLWSFNVIRARYPRNNQRSEFDCCDVHELIILREKVIFIFREEQQEGVVSVTQLFFQRGCLHRYQELAKDQVNHERKYLGVKYNDLQVPKIIQEHEMAYIFGAIDIRPIVTNRLFSD